MADRKNFHSGQKVKEVDLDAAFAQPEAADWKLVTDQGLSGIITGMEVTEAAVPDLTVQVASGFGYDKLGRRVRIPVATIGNFAEDENGNSTTADVIAGNERWLAMYARFARLESDARGPDLSNNFINFQSSESYEIVVVSGVQAAIGAASKPTSDAEDILICDTLYTFGQTQILDADLDFTRAEYLIDFGATGKAVDILGGTLPEAVSDIADVVNDVADGTIEIPYPGPQRQWADGTTNVFTAIPQPYSTAIDNIVTALAVKFSNTVTGDAFIGSCTYTVGAVTIPTGTVRATLQALTSSANINIIASPARPDATARAQESLEARIQGLVTDYGLTTASNGGARFVGMDTGVGNFGAKNSVRSWLLALGQNTGATANGAYFVSLYGTGLGGGFAAVTDVYGGFARLVRTNAGSDGASHIGTEAVGGLAGATVRAQLTELDTEKAALAGATFTGALSRSGADATFNYRVPHGTVADADSTIDVTYDTYDGASLTASRSYTLKSTSPAPPAGARIHFVQKNAYGGGYYSRFRREDATLIADMPATSWATFEWDGTVWKTIAWGPNVISVV